MMKQIKEKNISIDRSPHNRPYAETSWHTLAPERVLSMLQSSPHGLGRAEAAARLALYGRNAVAKKAGPSALVIFLRQLTTPFILILIVIAAIVALLGKFVDAGVVSFIILMNSWVGFIHERRAEKALAALQDVLSPKTQVRRDGKAMRITAEELVPGDILLLTQGDRIPADARIVLEKHLTVDESLLTGESLPERKESKALPADHVPLVDRKNMLYAGTLIQAGTAEAVVVATGSTMELGKIAEAVKAAPNLPSLFEQRIHLLGRWVLAIVVVISIGFFLIGLAKQEPPIDMFFAAVAMGVSLIPEGLPVVVTLALAISVTRMAARRALVRRLSAVETFGSVTAICTDKTGTLTKNEMTVRQVVTPRGEYNFAGIGFSPKGSVTLAGRTFDPADHPDLLHVLTAGALANDAQLSPRVGDHTEVALLVAAAKAGLSKEALEANHPRLDVVPFDSSLGLMATLHKRKGGRDIYVKGAPETVLALCQMTEHERRLYLARTETFAHEALRVLAVAVVRAKTDGTLTVDRLHNLEFLGLVAMEDPPRDEARQAVGEAQQAGIRVMMVTGDNIETARAIAQKVGIPARSSESMEGSELDGLDDIALQEVVSRIHVFARVSPLHKLRIVRALKFRGEVVAVTGDGINDAPALSQAHVGVAMGESGTDAAREAAAIVLKDDNFASIVAAVEEGRTVYNNIQRVILYLMISSVGQAITIIFGFVAGLPLVLLPLQILWINLVDGLAGFPLTVEPPKRQVMQRPPRRAADPLITRDMTVTTVLLGLLMAAGALLLFRAFLAEDVSRARTLVFSFVVFTQLCIILTLRSKFDSVFTINLLRNRWLLPILGLTLLLMLVLLYVPVISDLFQHVPLSAGELILALLTALPVILVMETRKFLWKLLKPAHTPTIEASKHPA
jgi:magnesium-transporting ATPase (P-type)